MPEDASYLSSIVLLPVKCQNVNFLKGCNNGNEKNFNLELRFYQFLHFVMFLSA
ncbi:hypothetical protein C1H46_021101 [Malus baccata]|uniref:Uncharacterized protein n=1 Tax=Malus baccata TaxID=106549 RepID=A0A540M419_MALBA|nr:hypothetical protein C1H46_021101 [Malus baccata]